MVIDYRNISGGYYSACKHQCNTSFDNRSSITYTLVKFTTPLPPNHRPCNEFTAATAVVIVGHFTYTCPCGDALSTNTCTQPPCLLHSSITSSLISTSQFRADSLKRKKNNSLFSSTCLFFYQFLLRVLAPIYSRVRIEHIRQHKALCGDRWCGCLLNNGRRLGGI